MSTPSFIRPPTSWRALADGKAASPTFREALATDLVTDAVLQSAQSGRWEQVQR